MKHYVVTYLAAGMHYRFRCSAKNKRDAKKQCCECMFCCPSDIVEVEEELW